MKVSNTKKYIILLYALVLWILCGAFIGIGRSITTMGITLIIHAIAAPVFTSIITRLYNRNFSYTSSLQAAVIFLLFIIIMDAGLVASVFEKSNDMFKSIPGTWLPFLLIFLSSYITGIIFNKRNKESGYGAKTNS